VHLAGPRRAWELSAFNRGRSSLGHVRFAASNPPQGAIISYWIGPRAPAAGETEAESPGLQIDVLDAGNTVVRRLATPANATRPGIHRLVWDLRYQPVRLANPDGSIDDGPRGPWVLPGDYRVRLRFGDREQVRDVHIEGDPAIDISAAARAAWHDTLVSLHEMTGVAHAVVTNARLLEDQLDQIRETLASHPEAGDALAPRLDAIAAGLREILEVMLGEESDAGATQPGAPPLSAQIRQLYSAIDASTALPTAEQTMLTERSRELLAERVDAINALLEQDMPALRAGLDAAGVPWTPGRPIAPIRR
jgi:hypothetical protein